MLAAVFDDCPSFEEVRSVPVVILCPSFVILTGELLFRVVEPSPDSSVFTVGELILDVHGFPDSCRPVGFVVTVIRVASSDGELPVVLFEPSALGKVLGSVPELCSVSVVKSVAVELLSLDEMFVVVFVFFPASVIEYSPFVSVVAASRGIPTDDLVEADSEV